MHRVLVLKFGDNKCCWSKVTIYMYIVKLLILYQNYWFRTAGQAAMSNTDPDLYFVCQSQKKKKKKKKTQTASILHNHKPTLLFGFLLCC